MTEKPQGAVIEIVERRSGEPSGTIADEVIVPNEVRINGMPLLIPNDYPVKIHEVEIPGNSMVLATITVVAKKITIGAEVQP